MSLVAAITLVARQGLHHTALPHQAFNSLTSDPGQRALNLKLSGFQPVKRLASFLDDLKVEPAGWVFDTAHMDEQGREMLGVVLDSVHSQHGLHIGLVKLEPHALIGVGQQWQAASFFPCSQCEWFGWGVG